MYLTPRRQPRSPSFFRRLLAPALALGLASVVTALASSCGSSTAGTPPCDSVYAGKCGGTCASDFACPDGLYCGISGTGITCPVGGAK